MLLGALTAGICRGQPPANDVPGAQVLTRGPVHEAFAGIVTFNPEPGVAVTKVPPALIEEMPPEEKPAGDNVTWIPGYWAWDDERADFLWVSGTWRALPPGRQWMAGYWGKTTQGHQWTSGYWADASVRETTYLPPPPATVEVGPNIAAPSLDYGWTPGCWVWYQQRYAWRPGYWALGRVDWDWTPSHYVWTPRGYIFVGGFWDYPVARRGVLFAPVYFDSGLYVRQSYYSPSIVIDLGVFSDHLFLRPRYHHYYFGDYYAPSYVQVGFYASFSFQSGHHGYDPIHSHHRWEHRHDRDWGHRVEASYQHRRDHEAARPPRTWAAQRDINPATPESRQNRVVVAAPISQVARMKDGPVRFQPVAKEERQQLAQRGQEVQKVRDQRQTLEARTVEPAPGKPGKAVDPARVQLPRSPIVAKPASQSGKNQVPPKAPQAPKPNLKVEAKTEPPGRPPNVERGNPQPQSRQPEPDKQPAPARGEAAPVVKPAQPPVQPAAPPSVRQPRPKEREPKSPQEPRPGAGGVEKNAPRVTQPPAYLRPAPVEKGASKILKQPQPSQGKGQPRETPPTVNGKEPVRP